MNKLLFSHEDEMRKALRILEFPLSSTTGALNLNVDALQLDLNRNRIPTIDGESRRLAELASSIGTAHSRAADLLGNGSPYRSILDQVAVTKALSVATAGLPSGDIYGLAARSALGSMDRFRIPEINEVSRLLRSIANPIERQYGLASAVLERSLAAMHQPWLDVHDTLASATGIAKLHGIGHLVASEPPFAANVAKVLRTDFGDWRDPITWPRNLASDLGVRADLYVERGFNQRLTKYPIVTFEEGLESSGLQEDTPVLVATYGDPVPRSGDLEEETSFARNNLVHDWLQRFETQIRQFIDMAMTAAFGVDWPRHRMPNGLYEEWLTKKTKDSSGLSRPLISYADFTDYERIICKQDNWRTVFAPRFRRPELVRESLQRLYPSRVATMHAHPLIQEDELFVFVEIKRLVRLFVS
ncbi:hypothetical protein NKI15_12440 [Mesorhizobium sp. M0862]|uniref:hypothetical protein n=1 Tax=Mesorhizobium sp. M0862 TaxID=2957015 RepID=UPI0033381F7C